MLRLTAPVVYCVIEMTDVFIYAYLCVCSKRKIMRMTLLSHRVLIANFVAQGFIESIILSDIFKIYMKGSDRGRAINAALHSTRNQI